MSKIEEVNEIALMDMQRINERFILEAEREWDKRGGGCFAVFVKAYVEKLWYLHSREN